MLDSEAVRTEESVHSHDSVGVGKPICVVRDVLSVSGMSSFNVDREELGNFMNRATTTHDNDNDNDDDDNNDNFDKSTSSHVQCHGLEDLTTHAAKSSLHGFPDEPLKLKTEFGARDVEHGSSRIVKAPVPAEAECGYEPGGMVYRAPFVNVAPVGSNRAASPPDSFPPLDKKDPGRREDRDLAKTRWLRPSGSLVQASADDDFDAEIRRR